VQLTEKQRLNDIAKMKREELRLIEEAKMEKEKEEQIFYRELQETHKKELEIEKQNLRKEELAKIKKIQDQRLLEKKNSNTKSSYKTIKN